ncbi:EcoAI/FtnUII family type I restriction enzme subunit R [Mycoplasma phocoenae]|uniref:DEAD/DEAH box helicase family protein n=1 Tax=Mycoplasma phocoenae TaxID=754517 RepID=A0A858U325_9MOLU|nr:DEAD/DEAH box helicase family protein [Mycoplasma phocoenae]QJG66822.1 DEAD/DEAH box helicase family protein [Mycoplasma phocoenae]
MECIQNKKQMSEEDIKLKFITPAIEKAGWDKFENIVMEHSFTDGRIILRGDKAIRGKGKKADYVLYYKKNKPLAIVEAKANIYSLRHGIEQAIEYGDILDIPFVYSSNGDGFLEHDMLKGVEREIKLDEFPSKEELWNRYISFKQLDAEDQELILQPYYFSKGDKTPRYYQQVAINRTIEAVAKDQKRILLTMATGTGKTYTAFQIIHKLWKSGNKKKILYLADRNILIDQTINQDFAPFKKVMTKIEGKKLDSSYEIFLSLYQQLVGYDGEEDPFLQFKPDFFDLIVIDECHRGSAKEDSEWRRILDYFSSATQIGMTATPKETKDVSNSSYFGEPIYTYSLKQGIDDGFLAPYKVVRIGIDIDIDGWRPNKGQLDESGKLIEDRIYNVSDYDRHIVIDDRTQLVAKRITQYLKSINDRFAKTIVFCVDIDHAERMRQALVNENSDLVAKDNRYIMRITGDNPIGIAQLDNFIDAESKYPVIVTTSRLMTTGVDCKTCKVIVLESNINSITEFKQIIGRGTRLKPDCGKEFFTILDTRGSCRLFADPDFDGEPISNILFKPGEEIELTEDELNEIIKEAEEKEMNKEIEDTDSNKVKYIVNDVEVNIVNERIQYYDKEGRLITENLIDYSKKNILGEFATLESFINKWKSEPKKKAIIEELQEQGVLLEALRDAVGIANIDDFDLICHVAFDQKPLTRKQRANKVKTQGYLQKYSEKARKVLDSLLDKYMENGIDDLEDISILQMIHLDNMETQWK